MSTLYVVGTPIGNLKDITYRAVETLKSVDLIACEDTRTSLKLLSHYEISKPLISYHKHNEKERSLEIVEMLENGKNVAVISDAGMPGICDPGAILINECREQNIKVEIIPGPSACISALSLIGLESSSFTFLGFLPEKQSDKLKVIDGIKNLQHPVAMYVSPHDIQKTVSLLLKELGNRRCFLVRELTKIYEEVLSTTLADFSCTEKGEMVFVIMPSDVTSMYDSMSVEEALTHCINNGMDKKEAVKLIAKEKKLPKNEVYSYAIKI